MRRAKQILEDWPALTGILLIIATLLAMIIENSPFSGLYNQLLNVPVQFRFGDLNIDKTLLLWVNDGLMALFFLMVGLEIKREVLQGDLKDRAKAAFPVFAAIGGIVAPALIYAYFNQDDPNAMRGWAIPTATDIAFAVGVLSLLGSRVPPALKLFLLTLAIADDLGAILIIAIFYTADLSLSSLWVAALAAFGLLLLNRFKVYSFSPYMLLGIVMWVAVLKSGVHATLAGVVLAMFIPLAIPEGEDESMAKSLEKDLMVSASFLILPLFAFMNTGISLEGMSLETLLHPVPVGIALGLILGKPIGIMLFSGLAIILRVAKMPEGVNWSQLFGVSMLAGIGFTMSLFIGSLAFGQSETSDRLGILIGSTVSAVVGYIWLKFALPKAR